MKTTVDIPDALYGQARKLAAARRQHIGALIAEGLERLVMERPRPARSKAAKGQRLRRGSLSPEAARWLSEWRALGRPNGVGQEPTSSAAEIVRQMRR